MLTMLMITRQHTKEANCGSPVKLDFDLSQKYWRLNKTSIGSSYKYICMATTKQSQPCRNPPQKHCNYCKLHNQSHV